MLLSAALHSVHLSTSAILPTVNIICWDISIFQVFLHPVSYKCWYPVSPCLQNDWIEEKNVVVNTLSVMRYITCLERHSQKFTTSVLIIFGHRQGILLPMKHIENTRVVLCQKGEEWSEIAKGNFFKNHRNFSPCTAMNKRLSIANLILKVDFVTAVLAVVCGYAQPRRQAFTIGPYA